MTVTTADPSATDHDGGDAPVATDSPKIAPAEATVTSPEIPVIELVEPMPGFPDHHRFALVQLDDAGVLCALRSLDDSSGGDPDTPGLRFLVVPPSAFFPDYEVVLPDEVVARLAITSAADVVVLAVVNPGATLDDSTANLLAPVVVNTANRRGVQVLLDADHPVRAPLLAS